MTLTSSRLVYTKFTLDEYPNYWSWYTDDDVMKYITGKGLTEHEAKIRFKRALATNNRYPEMGYFSVKKKDDHAFVGVAKLVMLNDSQAEVGYGSMPEFWKMRFGSEMLGCLMDYALQIPRIEELIALVHPSNTGSKKVLTNKSFLFYEAKMEGGRPVEYYKFSLRQPLQVLPANRQALI